MNATTGFASPMMQFTINTFHTESTLKALERTKIHLMIITHRLIISAK